MNFLPQVVSSSQPLHSGSSRARLCEQVQDSFAGCCEQDHGIYSKMQFGTTPTMGLPGAFPTSHYQIGEPSDEVGKDWSRNLGDVPKDCYYCAGSGMCALDVPQWGSGKDYTGQDCNACSGKGVCYHCGGDGIIGKPRDTVSGRA